MINLAEHLVEILSIRPGETYFIAGVAHRNALQEVDDRRIRGGRPQCRVWHSLCSSPPEIAQASGLDRGKEERAIMNDRAAEDAAKLVAFELVTSRSLPLSRIEN